MMKRVFPPVVSLLAGLSLLACGEGAGSSSAAEEHQRAVARANAEEAEARALGSDLPCEQVQQCANLSSLQLGTRCSNYLYQPYCLAAPTAVAAVAASAAAAEQRALASQANALAPPSNMACPAAVNPQPLLDGTAGRCRVASSACAEIHLNAKLS